MQLRDPVGTVSYFTSLNIPAPQITVWVSIAVHLLGGIGILIGFMTRWAAALLILLCLGTAFGVHLPAGDMENMMHFYKIGRASCRERVMVGVVAGGVERKI